QYTGARANSVLLKSDGQYKLPENYEPNAQEFEVIKELAAFPEILKEAAEKYEPCYVSRFAVSLAQKFNKFYIDCKILTAEGDAKSFRLALTKATLQTLKNALAILGISMPEKM
ncbi:MAG: arginine--tRNA ligase, partial [Clostridia bacterium]|nr:arginine--tRNA ligase [Clostridia bacterium]